MRQKKICIPIFLLFSCYFLITMLSASGKQEDPYAEAAQLLKEGSYTESLKNIIETSQKQPETFSNGSALARKALRDQSLFDKKLEELLNVIYTEPKNENKKLKIINEIVALKVQPDPTTAKLLKRLRASSSFALDRLQFFAIMKEVNTAITKNNLRDAMHLLTSGYELFKTKLKGSVLPEKTRSSIAKDFINLQTVQQNYNASITNFIIAKKNYMEAITTAKNTQSTSEIKQFLSEAEKILRLRDEIFNQGKYFETILKSYHFDEYSVNAEAALQSMEIFLNGTTGGKNYFGVSSVTTLFINNSITEIENLLKQTSNKHWSKKMALFDFKQPADNNTKFIENIKHNLFDLQKLYVFSTEKIKKSISHRIIMQNPQDYTENFTSYISQIQKARPIYNDYLVLQKKQQFLPKAQPALLHDKTIEDTLLTRLKKIKSLLEFFQIKLPTIKRQDANNKVLKLFFSEAKTRLQNMKTKEALILITYLSEIGLASLMEDTNNFENLLKNSAASSFQEKYNNLNDNNSEIKKDIKDLISAQNNFNTSYTNYQNTPQINLHEASITQTINSLNQLIQTIAIKQKKLKIVLNKIELAKREANFHIKDSKQNLAKAAFTKARKSIIKAREKINTALSLEEDKTYRKKTDNELAELDKVINQQENEIIVKDVRKAIEKSKKEYFTSNYGNAKRLLLNAKKRWEITHINENIEIATWLNIVNNAISINAQRSITPIEPLYPQMSQLLNTAILLFNDAKTTLKSNRKSGLKKLRNSEKNIHQVLVEYPHNKIAGELALHIDKLLNPKAFAVKIKTQLREISINYKKDPQKYYSDLLNIYALDKSFPGIKKLRLKMEYYLGIRLKEPDKKILAKSTKYTQEAKRIYKSKNKDLFEVAIQKLDEALKLNPNNISAMMLKDRIQTALGGQSVTVLSGKNEEKYQQAINNLQKGNTLLAAALVNQLLKDPQAKHSAKIIDLKKRIDSRL